MSAVGSQREARRSGRALLAVACVGLFVTQLDLTVVNVAVTAVREDLNASLAAGTWVVAAYFVTFAAFMLSFGDIGDLYGRHRVFLGGLVVFTAASVGCAVAPGVGWLIAARAGQGVAGAAVLVSSLALIVHGFPAGERARAIGWWSAVAGLSMVVGPVLGGLLVDGFGWRSVFWINLPIGVVGVLAGYRVLPRVPGVRDRGLDWAGQVLAVAAIGALAWALETGWRSPAALGAFAAAFVGIVVFVRVERRSGHPLVPMDLFRSVPFAGANGAALLLNAATLGLLFLLSLKYTAGLGAAEAGARIAPLFAAYALVSPFGGRIAARHGPRLPAALGTAVAGACVLVLPHVGTLPGVALLVLAGLGIGMALPAIVTTAVGAVPAERGGLGSGLNNTARQIGGTFGVALLGGVAAAEGVGAALVFDAVAYLLAALVAVLALPKGT
ncbi:EmrB/QacA subfamily drug resistance transporter [Actinocorallia herbida]|uniref:EmrB/QacA subfamily drug resistance transporter n=1 Tax=Actinocorallia herbida TaxID=58109 RepID=A0A3N1CNP0_9ACTN|nr:MFS transporter [Actinocorallia herbida]ROO82947.1 EmrB/QacA subfamily drug resistance transporter [Actinocorallia herbida]